MSEERKVDAEVFSILSTAGSRFTTRTVRRLLSIERHIYPGHSAIVRALKRLEKDGKVLCKKQGRHLLWWPVVDDEVKP